MAALGFRARASGSASRSSCVGWSKSVQALGVVAGCHRAGDLEDALDLGFVEPALPVAQVRSAGKADLEGVSNRNFAWILLTRRRFDCCSCLRRELEAQLDVELRAIRHRLE